jgi:site-specific recombinase XerD
MMSINDAIAAVNGQNKQQQLLYMRAHIASTCPTVLKALKLIDYNCSIPKRRKGFNLVKRENKRLGFVYYVRYSHDGKTLPTKWNTHTNVLCEAENFAIQNKERLVSAYVKAHDTHAFSILESFYKEDSLCDRKRMRPLSARHQKSYGSVITTKFIPFLKERNITGFAQIDTQVLSEFQDWLSAKGLKAQSVNWHFNSLSRVFKYLTRKALITENPCSKLEPLPVYANERNMRGCHEVEKLSGVFNKPWDDETHYLLCLLIYTTGMRNAEIKDIRVCDIIEINGCHFIDIKMSKTINGVRLVPLHDFVYQKLKSFKAAKSADGYIFRKCTEVDFADANIALGKQLGIGKNELAEQNITFYSGRHFWKTMMNSEGLGDDIEEIFMGHKVSGDVSKLYNHKDKQGKPRMVKKARQVFSILDKCLF